MANKKPAQPASAKSTSTDQATVASATEASNAPQPEKDGSQSVQPTGSDTSGPVTPDTPEGEKPASAVDPSLAKSAKEVEPTHECTVVSPLRHNGDRYKIDAIVMLFKHEFERLEKSGAVILNKILGETE